MTVVSNTCNTTSSVVLSMYLYSTVFITCSVCCTVIAIGMDWSWILWTCNTVCLHGWFCFLICFCRLYYLGLECNYNTGSLSVMWFFFSNMQNYILNKIWASAFFLKYSSNLANFSLVILTKYIHLKRGKKECTAWLYIPSALKPTGSINTL